MVTIGYYYKSEPHYGKDGTIVYAGFIQEFTQEEVNKKIEILKRKYPMIEYKQLIEIPIKSIKKVNSKSKELRQAENEK